MKKIIIPIILVNIFLVSCSDFLDKASLSDVSNDTYWDTEDDANRGLAGCYNSLTQEGLYFTYPGWATASPRELEFATDNGFFSWIPWLAPDVITTNTLSATSNVNKMVWKASYRGIARCNEVIHHVSIMTAEQISPESANQIICEAKFIRALLYNHLTSLFRDVPLTLDILTVSTSQVAKSPKSVVVNQIISDLKEITGDNKLSQDKELGRATKGAALALLCRVYLYNEMYSEAAKAAQDVINLNKYEIDPAYSTLFTERGNTSSEIIYSIRFKYSSSGEGTGGFLSYNYGYPMEWLAPYKNLSDDFYCKDGKSISTSPLYDANDDSKRDPRLTYSIVTQNSTWEGTSTKDAWWSWNTATRLFTRKYQIGGQWSGDSQDFYVIRYADVLLMRAEALAKLSQNKSEIMDLINQVRQRSDVMMPTVQVAEGGSLSFDQLFDVIKHERRVELAFEGFRYFDLLRWKEMEAAYAKCRAEGVGGSHIFDPSKGYVWPIPQSELDNNRALIQAPEWGGK